MLTDSDQHSSLRSVTKELIRSMEKYNIELLNKNIT
jgi:hypothetical protein